MTTTIYGYTSKQYPFGLYETALPTRAMVVSTFGIGPSERIILSVSLGKTSAGVLQYRTIFDKQADSLGVITDNVPSLLNTELDMTAYTPGSVAAWITLFKIQIICDSETPDLYTATDTVTLYTYRNNATGTPYVSFSPLPVAAAQSSNSLVKKIFLSKSSSYTGSDGSTPDAYNPDQLGNPALFTTPVVGSGSTTQVIPQNQTQQYTAVNGVQTQFVSNGVIFKTIVSDVNGKVTTQLPPGSYEVRFYGSGYNQNSWLTGSNSLSVGSTSTATKFGDLHADVSQFADFTQIKAQFGSLTWVKHMVAEDFTSARVAYRDENADTHWVFTNLANFNFGRLYKGNSYVEYVGIGTDPAIG